MEEKKWKYFIPFYGIFAVYKSENTSKGKWYTISILITLLVLGIAARDKNSTSTASVSDPSIPKEYKANSFYSQATGIEQHGTTIYVEFAPSLDGTGYTQEATAGKVNVNFRWSGMGVPPGKVANATAEVTEEMYSCTVFCKAKLTFEVPNAFIEASYLDTTIELIPKGKTKGFKTSKQIISF